MLDAFKKTGATRQQSDELQALIAQSREERAALSTMLTQMQMQSAKLASAGKALQEVDEKADKAHARLDDVTERLAQAAKRTSELETIDARIQSLVQAVAAAETETARLTAPDGELQKHKQALQELSSQTVQTRASLESLRTEQAAVEGLRDELRQTQDEIRNSNERAGALKTDYDHLRGLASQLTNDYGALRDTSREAHDETNATVELVREMEQRLASLSQLQEMSRSVEERMTTLDGLADYVGAKTTALESQKETVDHAVTEANRLNEMVWAMEAQINKLNEGARQAIKTEELIERVEKLARDVGAQLEGGLKAREAFAADLDALDKDRTSLTGFVRGYLDKLSIERRELDAFDQRVKVLQTAVAQAEKGMETLAVRERAAAAMVQRADQLTKQFDTLNASANDLQRKQVALEGLRESLAQVDALAKRTAGQYEALNQSRRDLDVLRGEIQDFHKSYAAAAKLRDQIGADRADLESFLARATEFSGGVPELEARISSVTSRLTLVDDAARKASSLTAMTEDLERRMTRLSGQQEVLARVEGRLQALHALSGDVDNRMEAQIVRRNEVESLHNRIEGIAVAVMDAQLKLEALDAVHAKIGPLGADLTSLRTDLDTVHERYAAALQEESAIAAQEKRLIGMLASSREAALEASQRFEQVQALASDLQRSSALKDELLQELAQVAARQREVAAHTESAEAHLARLEAASRALDERRAEVAHSERRIAAFETRAAELAQMTDALDIRIADVVRREALVEAIRQEVAAVQEVSARIRADLDHVADLKMDARDPGESAARKSRRKTA